jgi:lipoate---protein ligase
MVYKGMENGSDPIRLINLGMVPDWQTQAVYHALAEGMQDDSPDTIVICWPKEPYLCLGYHQVFASVFDPAECARRRLPVFRRRIGGGATYLDQNQIFYQCIFHHQHAPAMLKDIYAFFLAGPVMALRRIGLNAVLREMNEIEVDGRRIAGTGGGRMGDAIVVVGNLLFDFDYEAMAAVWHTPSASFRLLATRALQESVTTLKQFSISISIEETINLLAESFLEAMGRPLVPGKLTVAEIQSAVSEAEGLGSESSLGLHKNETEPEYLRELKISARSFIRYGTIQIDGRDGKGSSWLKDGQVREMIPDYPVPPEVL